MSDPDRHGLLSETEIREIIEDFVDRERLAGKRVLAIIPDHTRSAPMGILFRELYRLLAQPPGVLDLLIALGTHPPMSESAIDRRLELSPGERSRRYSNTRVFGPTSGRILSDCG